MWKQQRDKKYRFFEQYKDPLTNKQKTVVYCKIEVHNYAT